MTVEKELKLAEKELEKVVAKMDKIKKQLDNHQKEHKRHELRFKKFDTNYQEKRAKMQVTVQKNIDAAVAKEESLVPLLTQDLQLKAQIEVLRKLI